MEQVEVEILSQTITSQYGVLSAGAILRTDAAFAAHLVDDCMAAKYTKARPRVETESASEKHVDAATNTRKKK